MRQSFLRWLVLLHVAAILVAYADAAPGRSRLVRAAPEVRIAGRYIIRLDPDASPSAINKLIEQILFDQERPDLTAQVLAVLEGAGAVSVSMSARELERIRQMDTVLEIVEDQVVRASQYLSIASSAQQGSKPGPVALPEPYSWAIDRVLRRKLNQNDAEIVGQGQDVDIYIADTGIERSHPEFGGRAQHFFTFYGVDSLDDNGHGTHAAGLAGGATRGLAKYSQLFAVKVLGSDGLGSITSLLAGMNEVYMRRNRTRPAVLSMSVEGFQSSILDDMVDRLVLDNVAVVVSAGNTQEDACTQSPAHAPRAITVAATNETDSLAWFSNFGPCVDILAPGANLQSAWLHGQYLTLSGTSTSCPLVAGAVAVYRGLHPSATMDDVQWGVMQAATIDVVKMPTSLATPNRLLYAAFECPVVASPPPTATYTVTYTLTITQSVTVTLTQAATQTGTSTIK